ncbi:MAG: helix-turn-helix domain-containing protein, partial [Pseudonocardiaceae bacterium]
MVNRAELDQARVELGRQLAASRRAARLSQTALGGLIGCVRSTVSHIEHARRRSDRTFWK